MLNSQIVNVGDYIQFGKYPQGASGEVEPLDWRVLAVWKGRALLITKMAVEFRAYNEERNEIIWERCTLRQWSNGDFFNAAFSPEEQGKMSMAHNENNNNSCCDKKGSYYTHDKVFCLSVEEAKEYFSSDDERAVTPTDYAKSQRAGAVGKGNCSWWLRSSGSHGVLAANVTVSGNIDAYGNVVHGKNVAVRPAIWIYL